MDLDQVWEEKKILAEKGREFWITLLKENQIDDQDGVLVLLNSDWDAAGYLIAHGNEMIQKGKYNRIFVLTDSSEPVEMAEWIQKVILCTQNQMASLKELYQVYKFTNQIIWGTLSDIEDANGYQLIGFHDITKEELIRTAIMDIS